MRANPNTLILFLLLIRLLSSEAASAGDGARVASGDGSRHTPPSSQAQFNIRPFSGVYVGRPVVTGSGLPVPVPQNAYERPERLYVLPVIVAPTGDGHWLPDPDAAGLNLDGNPFVGRPSPSADTYPVQYARAANNLSAHLHTAREMYERMLRNPLNDERRGTFALATWDAAAGIARRVVSRTRRIDPLVMELVGHTRQDIVDQVTATPAADAFWVEEILDRIGCQRMSCPFALAIFVVGNPFNPEHGAKWNYGYNNGGGGAYFNYSSARDSWNTDPAAGHDFLSTLVHELGHAFGMPHIADYCGGDACPADPRLGLYTSGSIMSYNASNKIYGCPYASGRDPTHCDVPTPEVVDQLPGIFEREDKRVLNANKLAFPELDYQAALDHPNPTDAVHRFDAGGDWDITSVGRLYVDSPDDPGTGPRASVVIGGFSESFLEIEEQAGQFTWTTSPGALGTWANYHVYFPATVTLERLRVYGGFQGNTDRPLGLQLFAAGHPSPIATAYNLTDANNDLHTINNAARTGRHFVLQVQRGSSGFVRLRGLRFFGRHGGHSQTVEFYPPAEPVATTGFGSTFGGSIDNVVGSDQLVANATLPFQPQASWHSSARTPGSWVSVDVEMPRETRLSAISVRTGHSAGVHRARGIQIERECVCRYPYSGAGASCGVQSIAECSAAGGVGRRVYEVVKYDPDPAINAYVSFPQTTAKRWRIALRTADGPAGSDSWMVLRALRFWSPGAGAYYELFPPRDFLH